MKLLLCTNCNSIFNITTVTKSCTCGLTSGKYLDESNAVYSGRFAIPIVLNHTIFIKAVNTSRDIDKRFIGYTISKNNTPFKSTEKIE